VIIDRRVNIGQTVVSSLNAPSLFLIAKDLGRMQVWVSVNEADIGSIHAGQPVTFTVDAYSGQVFHGVVNKVRLNAAMTQNVVTYTVEVTTENPDGKLLPYLTANAKFEVQHDSDVLVVPNAALRWSPQPEQVVEGARAAGGADSARRMGTLWVTEGTRVRPLPVHVGPSDGTVTEVRGDGVQEGLQVVIGDRPADGGARPTATGPANPFTPQMGRSRTRQQ
jgi:HlyD family secretion protein